MTAKEKAKELVNRFRIEDRNMKSKAIQCALICVDEILETPLHVYGRGYWENVKQEIEKL